MSRFALPSYSWRAPVWTGAHDAPVLYDEFGWLLIECTLLEEVEPALERWAAARERQPSDPLLHTSTDERFAPAGLLSALETLRREASELFGGVCGRLEARHDAFDIAEDCGRRIVEIWEAYLGEDLSLAGELILARKPGNKLRVLKELLGEQAKRPEVAAGLAEIEDLVAKHDRLDAIAHDEDVNATHARADSITERASRLVRHIHRVCPHPVTRSIPRAPPSDPDAKTLGTFVLPVGALRAKARLVRELAAFDAFLASGLLPREESYLPSPEVRLGQILRGRAAACAVLERNARAYASLERWVARRDAEQELRSLCLHAATSCALPEEVLDPLRTRFLSPTPAHTYAADVLAELASSDHPLAAPARARISATMAFAPRAPDEPDAFDDDALAPTEQEHTAIEEARFALIPEVPLDVLY